MVYTICVHLHCNDKLGKLSNKPDSIPRLQLTLMEASRIYRKDEETVDWFVTQDAHDPGNLLLLKRFEIESVRETQPFDRLKH